MTTADILPAGLSPDLVVDFDIYDPSLTAPIDVVQERLAELSAKGPVVYSTAHGGHWVVTHYKEIQAVLTDPETFSSYPNNLVTSEQDIGMLLPVEADPPQHTGLRQALLPLFSPQRMKKLDGDIREVVNELIDGFAARGEAEFVSEFAHELPARIFLKLMDLPLEDAPLFTAATDAILFGKPGGTEEESAEARMMAGLEMFGYFQKLNEKLRTNPGNDVTSAIINSEVDLGDGPRRLTDEELNRMFFVLLIAGLHTVQGSLAWMMLHLVNNPEQRAKIVEDPTTIPKAVEEVLRMEGAIAAGRRATRDVEVGGVHISEGDQLLVMIASADRDGKEFRDPHTFDIARTPNRHLAFGSGPHRCIGSHLARVELNIAMQELHRRIPDYTFVEGDPPVFHASQVRGCARMPITFPPETKS
jgi:cytochrome P450